LASAKATAEGLPWHEPAIPRFLFRPRDLRFGPELPGGGAIPAFIKNTGSQIGIRKLFAAIRKQVRDPKYAKGPEQKD